MNPDGAARPDSCRVSARTGVTRRRTESAVARERTVVSRRYALARLWLMRPRGGRDVRNETEPMDAAGELARGAGERGRRAPRVGAGARDDGAASADAAAGDEVRGGEASREHAARGRRR